MLILEASGCQVHRKGFAIAGSLQKLESWQHMYHGRPQHQTGAAAPIGVRVLHIVSLPCHVLNTR